jgi:hypothetical protein
MWPTSVIFKKQPKENTRPIGENSPNYRKFAESGHPGCVAKLESDISKEGVFN